MAKALLAIALWLTLSFSVLAAAPQKKHPAWADLTREQQRVLAPLAPDWDKFSARRKRTWLGIAKKYSTMTPLEQAKVQRRMQPWSKLTPEQRRAARKRFRKLQKLSPEKRQSLREKWEEYQRLPEAQLRQLEASGKAPKPVSKSSAQPRKKPRANARANPGARASAPEAPASAPVPAASR